MMETAHRLPRFFVLWSTLIFAAVLLAGVVAFTRLNDMLWEPRTGGSPLFWVVLRVVGPSAITVIALGVGEVFRGLLLRRAIAFRRWVAYSASGAFAGSIATGLVPTGAVSVLLSTMFADTTGTRLGLFLFLPAVLGGFVRGGILGFVQGQSLVSADRVQARNRLAAASALAWGLRTFVGLVGMLWHERLNEPGWIAVFALASNFIPGLVTGLALKRIVESTPAPAEDVGTTPEVPSAAGPVQ